MTLFDLSGIFQVQRALLADISNTYTGSSNQTLSTSMNTLQTNLNDLNTKLNTGSASLNYALTRQNEVNNILNREHTRLESKKDQINNYHQTVVRSSDLNDNIRKRQASFIKVFLIIIGLTLLYIVLIKVNQTMPFPGYLLEFIMVILFSLGGIYLFLVLRDIYTRSNMNFDKLYLPPPNSAVSPDKIDSAKQKAKNEGSLLGSLVGDLGLDYTNLGISGETVYAPSINRYINVCATAGEVYDLSSGNCVAENADTDYTICGTNPKVRVPITTGNDRRSECINPFSTQRERENINSVQPYTPSEKNEYGFL